MKQTTLLLSFIALLLCGTSSSIFAHGNNGDEILFLNSINFGNYTLFTLIF